MVEHLEEASGDVNEWIPVAAASLDQQHFGAGVLGQPAGEHTASRAGADDDIVRLHAILPQMV
jgi:hypothetical protein